MTLAQCIANTAAELGIPEREVKEIAERLQQQKKRLEAGGRLDRADADLRQFAKDEAEKLRIAAALKRKQAALNVLLRHEWEQDLARLKAAGLDPREAIMAKLVGSYAGVAGARKSASARRLALEGDWLGGLAREMEAAVPGSLKLLKRPREAKPLLDNIVREWRELKDGGNPGVTGSKDAQALAKVLAKYGEASRLEANRAGANIGRLDGWGGPQAHDEAKLLRLGKDAWVQRTLPLLDLDRSFAGAPDPAKALGDVWDNIVTGRGQMESAKTRGERVGPTNLARSLEKARVLHFKDADAWIAYNDAFGRGNVITGMIDHLHGMARTVANMQVMGPNPQVFLESVLEMERSVLRAMGGSKATQKRLAQLEADLDNPITSRIGKAFAEVMGDTYRPANLSAAKVGAGVRAVQSMAKLGGAVISSVTDLVTFAHALRFQGQGMLQAWGGAFQGLMQGRTKREQQDLALSLSVGFDTLLGDIHSRWSAQDSLPGAMSDAQRFFFKLSGLNWWTERLTSAFTAMSSNWMARQAGKGWDALDPRYRTALGVHGLDAARWELVRHAVGKADDGNDYVLPELVRNIPDEVMPEKARRELELTLRSFFADEASFAVLRADDRTRTITTQGTSGGTVLGEAIRFMMQFKTFPIAYAQKVLMPALRGRGKRDYPAIASLIAGSWALGYLAMTAKDVLKNREPKDPAKIETWMAALLQGGGAGIYGDFLFGQVNRFGGGLAGTLMGPTLSTADDLHGLVMKMRDGDAKAGDAFWLVLNNTPYMNLWWSRAALDLAILNQMQEWMSPGTLRRREKRLQKDFGQGYLMDPTPLS